MEENDKHYSAQVECRICKQIPLFYYMSRVLKSDFICPSCSQTRRNKWRGLRKKELELKKQGIQPDSKQLLTQEGLF